MVQDSSFRPKKTSELSLHGCGFLVACSQLKDSSRWYWRSSMNDPAVSTQLREQVSLVQFGPSLHHVVVLHPLQLGQHHVPVRDGSSRLDMVVPKLVIWVSVYLDQRNVFLTSSRLLRKFPKTDFRFRRARPRISFGDRGGPAGLADEESAILERACVKDRLCRWMRV